MHCLYTVDLFLSGQNLVHPLIRNNGIRAAPECGGAHRSRGMMHLKSSSINGVPVVWIVGRHPLVAEHLVEILARHTAINAKWAGEDPPAETTREAPRIFVLDSMGIGLSVVECIRHLKLKFRAAKYIVLVRSLETYSVSLLLSEGVQGFLIYAEVSKLLHLAIHTIANGGTWVDPGVLQNYMRRKRHGRQQASPKAEFLTEREDEILALVRQRLSNREIASLLNIQVSTVKFHLSHVFSKLQITQRSDLWSRQPELSLH